MSESFEKRFTVQQARVSKSGKSLGLLIGDGSWLATKDFSLADAVGQQFVGICSTQKFPDGGSMTWLNDYRRVSESPTGTPAHQLVTHKDASINALALCKAMGQNLTTVDKAWDAYTAFFRRMLAWDPDQDKTPLAAPEPSSYQDKDDPGFNDEIPF